ncbi:MAG: PilZ domain-containing protein [Thermodesulfovibrionales bacterium]|nr:PilZ domain-containing protein [Thermodesulfovibrionales bacterium]
MIAVREKKNIPNKRRLRRFSHRCRMAFTVDGVTYRGLSSNFSLNGLFVRTRNTFPPGTFLDITIYFPNELTSHLQGKVTRSSKEPCRVTGGKDSEYREKGMGIRILEKDSLYLHFIRALLSQEEEDLFGQIIFYERESKYRKIRSELQASSHLFDVYALVIGEQREQAGFMGKIWFEAKIKNNTDYVFVEPVVIFMTTKNDDHTDDTQRNSLPSLGTVLINAPQHIDHWSPGEIITLAGEINPLSLDVLDYEIEFLDYLIKTLEITAEEPVKIDNFVEAIWLGAPCVVSDSLGFQNRALADACLK